jgi:hypothetical protein
MALNKYKINLKIQNQLGIKRLIELKSIFSCDENAKKHLQ